MGSGTPTGGAEASWDFMPYTTENDARAYRNSHRSKQAPLDSVTLASLEHLMETWPYQRLKGNNQMRWFGKRPANLILSTALWGSTPFSQLGEEENFTKKILLIVKKFFDTEHLFSSLVDIQDKVKQSRTSAYHCQRTVETLVAVRGLIRGPSNNVNCVWPVHSMANFVKLLEWG